MRLSDLLPYHSIVIQCHDAPDADAIASGFALQQWFLSKGRDVPFVYGGRETRMKPNLMIMQELLGIRAEHVEGIPEPDLLITVDCRYGEKNVTKFPAKKVCVIDHHQVTDRKALPELSAVAESLGSCSTLLYRLLNAEGYDIFSDTFLQTALYYGLYMDTCSFQELWHPADRDMWDALAPDEEILNTLVNTNLGSEDLVAAGTAFAEHRIDREYRFGAAEADTKDRNILGVVSDTLLGVDSVDVCVAIADLGDMVRFSVRSCTKEVRADELAKVFSSSAGGHIRKAAGMLIKKDAGGEVRDWKDFFIRKYREYRDGTDDIHAGNPIDLSGFRLYRKLPVEAGVVDIAKLFPEGSRLTLRTLEGDISLQADSRSLLMIGVGNEIYPIKADTFRKNYRMTGEKYVFPDEYVPGIRNYETGETVNLAGIAEGCTGLGSSLVLAKQLTRRTHVFTIWDRQKYIYGKPGDWIAVQKDRPEDVYIIAGTIFDRTYEEA